MSSNVIPDYIPDDIKSLSFEQAMSQLEETVRKLEAGKVTLDESVDVYTRGVHLKEYCQFKLTQAEGKIDKLIIHKDASIEATSFDE